MKKLILTSLIAGALIISKPVSTQAQISVNVNIGSQPAWGPSGYNHVDYYYLPDIESYYDVSTNQYIYQDGGRWIFANNLPPRYRGYDLYSGYKVVVNRPKPYLNFSRDRVSYGRYKNWSGTRQPMLRESRNVNNRTVINNNVQINRDRNNGNHYGTNNRPGNGNHNDNNGNNHRDDNHHDDGREHGRNADGRH